MTHHSPFAQPTPPTVAEVHRRLVARIAAIKPPIEKSVYASSADQATELRKDADYLGDLQRALEPIIGAVIDQAVSFTGMRDISDRRSFLYQTLDDEILEVFRDRAADMQEEARQEELRF